MIKECFSLEIRTLYLGTTIQKINIDEGSEKDERRLENDKEGQRKSKRKVQIREKRTRI